MCTAPRKCVLCLPLLQIEWKEDIEWIAHHTHSDVKKYVAQLVLICDCSNKLQPVAKVLKTLYRILA